MKKIKFFLTTSALLGVIMACSTSDRELSPELSPKTVSNGSTIASKIKVIIGFYFTWDEWGRKSKDCGGGGLCNFRLETISIEIGNKSVVQGDSNGNYWVDIPIVSSMPQEYTNHEYLPVDEDIVHVMKDGTKVILKSGLYPKYSGICDNGGYRLPLYVD